jgi:phage shock protein E
MKTHLWFKVPLAVLTLAAAGALFVAACSSPAPSGAAASASPAVASAAPATAGPGWAQKIRQGALVLDVRTPQEWSAGHFSSARHVPVDQVAARLAEVAEWTGGDKTKPVVIYCQSGRRAAAAREVLLRAGFTDVENAGGLAALRAQPGLAPPAPRDEGPPGG